MGFPVIQAVKNVTVGHKWPLSGLSLHHMITKMTNMSNDQRSETVNFRVWCLNFAVLSKKKKNALQYICSAHYYKLTAERAFFWVCQFSFLINPTGLHLSNYFANCQTSAWKLEVFWSSLLFPLKGSKGGGITQVIPKSLRNLYI